MSTPKEAEEHLRVIRSLMERGTIYRAISAPVALIGGVATLMGCAVIAFASPSPLPHVDPMSEEPFNPLFLPTWLVVLAITVIANTYFLWAEARRRGGAFLSPGLRTALRSLLPSCFTAAVFTFFGAGASLELPVYWMILYGLSLLATQQFAPQSIVVLGWAFLGTGLALTLAAYYTLRTNPPDDPASIWTVANIAMGATFGVYHIIYAVATWPRQSTAAVPAGES